VRIADALAATFSRLGMEGRLREHEIFRVWPEVVGDTIARHAEAVSLKQARLLVHVTDPVWLHQLSMMRPRLLEALRERLGPNAVQEILLRIGDVSPRPDRSPALRREIPPPPDPRRLAEIETLLSPLKDDEARAAFRRLLLRHDRLGRR
jgi:hypothetical protein